MGLTESQVMTELNAGNKELNGTPYKESSIQIWKFGIEKVKDFVIENSTLLGVKDSDLTKPLAALEEASKKLCDILIKLPRPAQNVEMTTYCNIKKSMIVAGETLLDVTFRVDNKKKAQKMLLVAIQYLGGIATKLGGIAAGGTTNWCIVPAKK